MRKLLICILLFLSLAVCGCGEYEIAGVDYSWWIDNCEYIQIGARNSNTRIEESSAKKYILKCVDGIRLGKQVDTDISGYFDYKSYYYDDYVPYYFIRLTRNIESGKSYRLRFYDDCRYMDICDCHSSCKKEHIVYEVNSPGRVRRLMNKYSGYISLKDYKSLTEYASEIFFNVPISSLDYKADNTQNIPMDLKPFKLSDVHVSKHSDSYMKTQPLFSAPYRAEYFIMYNDSSKGINEKYWVRMHIKSGIFGWKTTKIELE